MSPPAAVAPPPRELFQRHVPTPLTRELREWIQTPLNPAAGASPLHSPTGQGLSRKKIWTTRRRKDGFPATGLALQESGRVHKDSGPEISTPLTKEIRAWYGDPHDPTGVKYYYLPCRKHAHTDAGCSFRANAYASHTLTSRIQRSKVSERLRVIEGQENHRYPARWFHPRQLCFCSRCRQKIIDELAHRLALQMRNRHSASCWHSSRGLLRISILSHQIPDSVCLPACAA